QVIQTLVDEDAPSWRSNLDFVVVWTRPEAVLKSFSRLLTFSGADLEELFAEVDAYAAMLLSAKDRARGIFVPSWSIPALHQGRGMLALDPRVGIPRILMQLNLRLWERLDGVSQIVPLNAAPWIEAAGEIAFSARRWYMGKVPFANEVFKAAARDLKSA